MDDIIYRDDCYRIMGACFEVYKDKGSGFTEPVYHECLAIEFAYLGIPFISGPKLSLTYRGQTLKHYFRPDFVCFGKIIVEIKALTGLADEHRAQTLNYLSATGFQLGLLVNFGNVPKVEWERFANTKR